MLSDSLTEDGVTLLIDLEDRQKYVTHPGFHLYTMRLYAESPEFYKKGNLLFLKNITNPIEEIYTDALPAFDAAKVSWK